MTGLKNKTELAKAWLKQIGVNAYVTAHRDRTFTAWLESADDVETASKSIHRSGGVVVNVSSQRKNRLTHYVRFDMSKAPFDLPATHGDLMLLLMTRARDVVNEMMSSEPDEKYLEQYQDDLWQTFATLPAPIGVKFTLRREGKVLRLLFRLTVQDDTEDGDQ